MAEIVALGSALPERTVTAAQVAEWTGGDEKYISNKVGIAERRFLAPDELPVDLAAQAVRNLLASHDALDLDRVGLLILVTQNPDFRIPQSSSLLCDRLGLGNDCASFDLGLGCSGWVYGLSVASGFMALEGIDNALLVTCDPYSRIMNRTDKATMTVFGDGAAATWLSTGAGPRFGRGDFGTDGSMGDQLAVQAGASASPVLSIDTDPNSPFDREAAALKMNGRAILEFMLTRIPESVQRCLDKNGLTREKIDLFVFHQASAYMVKLLARQMDLPPDKVPIDIRETGNTVSSSIPIVLERLHRAGALAGKKVLVSGFGVGLSWATNVVDF